MARDLIELIGSGIIAAGPPGLPSGLLECLREAFNQAAADEAFVEAVRRLRRTVDAGDGETVRQELEAASAAASRFAPLLREAAGKAYV